MAGSKKGRVIRAHKGGRTAMMRARVTPGHAATLRELCGVLGISIADWIEQKIEDDAGRFAKLRSWPVVGSESRYRMELRAGRHGDGGLMKSIDYDNDIDGSFSDALHEMTLFADSRNLILNIWDNPGTAPFSAPTEKA